MIFMTFVGNHDDLRKSRNGLGAVRSIFLNYQEHLERVYLLVTPESKNGALNYQEIAEQCKAYLLAENPNLNVELVSIDLNNPIDFDLVYPRMLQTAQMLLSKDDNRGQEVIINITSGTPTMTVCWLLLHKSGLIPKSKVVQAFEPRFASKRGKSIQEVSLDIANFPEITAPEKLRLRLDIVQRENKGLREQLDVAELDARVPELLGHSPSIRKIKKTILDYLDDESPVLIYGEPGTGKEQVAKAIWRIHHRPSDPELTPYNCSSFSEELIVSELFGHRKGAFTGADLDKVGIVKRCHGKMLFLDEITNLPMRAQQVLLRLLQFGEIQPVGSEVVEKVDVRIIAASNKDINDEKIFAQDLKGRFVERIKLAPLRERQEDIPVLANHFLNVYTQSRHLKAPVVFSKDVIELLKRHRWPGNVRDLENLIKRIIARFSGGEITYKGLLDKGIDDFSAANDEIVLPDLPLPVELKKYSDLIRDKALRMAGGNMAEADRLLGRKGGGAEKQRRYRKRKGG